MTDIYEHHAKAFAGVSAYVILHNNERVATIAFRHPTRGLRLWAYVHWHGLEMVRGKADGSGYDKASAAVEDAMRRAITIIDTAKGVDVSDYAALDAFSGALAESDGQHWDTRLRRAGFTVLQAI